ncbi:unnamed protein product [Cuscuta epithymum]|uniref:Uncharacterized protein n=1 Tax=Cuscuta epithymum TaxID=186058 RepID=A0AAV0C1T2_9ASTE|nr:unnamed protein product [Cuscuta epithymum]
MQPFVRNSLQSSRSSFLWEFKDQLKEGKLYSLKNFVVAPNTMTYKITTITNRFKTMFNFKKTLLDCPDESFPKAMYAFRPFYEIRNVELLIKLMLWNFLVRIKI